MNEQHEENLRRMLEQVDAAELSAKTSGSTLESLAGKATGELLESTGPGTMAQQEMILAQESVDAFVAGSEFDENQRFALEAIVLPFKRPVVDVVENKLVASQLTGDWRNLATDGAKRSTIENALMSVGRIEVPKHSLVPYAGTGFVVGKDLIMTNRHVAKIFVDGVGTRDLKFISGQTSAVDFLQEAGNEKTEAVEVVKVVMVHPYWDMAILKVSGLSAERKPLALSLADPSDIVGSDVVTVGYPGFTPSSDQEFLRIQSRVFRDMYYVKRVQPGKLRKLSEVESYDKIVSAVTHDCSTLGGNSGSAIIELATGNVVGLHFAGAYLRANYAVPSCELALDPRIVDAGVKYASKPNPQAGIHETHWTQADSESSLAESSTTTGDAGSSSQTHSNSSSENGLQSAKQSAVSITLPLVISVDIGTPQQTESQNVVIRTRGNEPRSTRLRNEGLFGPPPKKFSLSELKDLYSAKTLTKKSFRMSTARSMAVLSKFAYEDGAVVESYGKGGFGFQSCKFIEASGTQCFIASTENATVISFRGTESVGDWILNLRVFTTQRPFGSVHTGFLRGFEFVQMQLESELANLGDRRLLITGHSLGGALASVAAAMWEEKYKIGGVYTFGQPGVGLVDFASFINKKYEGKFFRFVNNSDVVTKVPPGFTHVGRLFHFDRNGSIKVNEESLNVDRTEMMSDRQFEDFKATIEAAEHSENKVAAVAQESLFTSVSDHGMDRYIEMIQKNV